MIVAVSDGLPRHDLASQPIGSVDASRQVAESVFPGLGYIYWGCGARRVRRMISRGNPEATASVVPIT